MLSRQIEKHASERTLFSWKEIAVFLDRAERTVKRWERERGLPVHRVPGGERGGVFAYPEELRAWLLGERGKSAKSGDDQLDSELIANRTSPHFPEIKVVPAASVETAAIRNSDGSSAQGFADMRRWTAWVAPPALLVVLAGASLLALRSGRTASLTRNPGSESAPHIPAPGAEDLYLKGRYEWSLRTPDSLRKSIDAYTQAIVKDPAYALAYAGLAESYDLLPEYEGSERKEAFIRAKEAADQAIKLDQNLAAGHRAKAFAMFYGDWDSPGSDAEFNKALSLAPNEAATHHWYATTLFSRRERSEALAQIDEAVRLSPTNPAIVADAAFLHEELGDNVEANIKTLRELARTQPNLVKASRYLEGIDLIHKDYGNYLADLRQTVAIAHNPDEAELLIAVEHGWARSGVRGLMEAKRDVDLAAHARGASTAYDIALDYQWLGQPRNALYYFNKALEEHDVRISWVRKDCDLAGLEMDPDYRALVVRIDERMHLDSSPSLNLAETTQQRKNSSPSPAQP